MNKSWLKVTYWFNSQKENHKIMNRKLFIFILFCLFSFSLGTLSYAQEKPKEEKTPEKAEKATVFRDEFKRDTPRGATKGFLDAAKQRDYKKAAKFLNLEHLPYYMDNETPSELARQLKVVFNQKLWIDINNISDRVEGSKDDNLPENQELIGVIRADHAAYDIILQKTLINNLPVWRISPKTVSNIPTMYEQFGHGVLGKFMPPILLEITIFKVTVGEWISLIVIVGLTFIVTIIITQLLIFILKRFKSKKILHFFNALLWPIRWLFVFIISRHLFEIFVYSVAVKTFMKSTTLIIIISAWFLFNLIDYLFDIWSANKRHKGKRDIIVFYSLFKKGLKLLILFIGITIWLDNLGFKVTTIIAGLGVGGIAVALAAQKTIEDILGAMTLLAARPVEVGDFVKFGDSIGTIEDISLRLTKVRTLDRTLVNIPNSKFVSLELENISKRDKIRFHPKIHLCYETTPDKLHCILKEISKLLSLHPKVLEDSRVRFTEFGTYSLECDILAYIDTTEYSEYLKIAEELNFSIMNIVKKAGAQLAIPSQNIYTQAKK